MIISDRYQFVFVHIPKNAGTFVRDRLKLIDPEFKSYGAVRQHQEIGELDYGHITLAYLQQYFDEEFHKLIKYHSFAVIRDPFERFSSSLAQRLRMYKKLAVKEMDSRQLRFEVDEAIKILGKYNVGQQLPADMIHFQRQVDYVFLNNQILINHLVDHNNVFDLFRIIKERIITNLHIEELQGKESNVTTVYRNRVFRLLDKSVIPYYQRLGVNSYRINTLIRRAKQLMYVPPNEGMKDVFKSKYVLNFISDYYKDDIILYSDVRKFIINED